jgi:hypothetical protein
MGERLALTGMCHSQREMALHARQPFREVGHDCVEQEPGIRVAGTVSPGQPFANKRFVDNAMDHGTEIGSRAEKRRAGDRNSSE